MSRRRDRTGERGKSIGAGRRVRFVRCDGDGFGSRAGHCGGDGARAVSTSGHRDTVAIVGTELSRGGFGGTVVRRRAQRAAKRRDKHREDRERRDRCGKTFVECALHQES